MFKLSLIYFFDLSTCKLVWFGSKTLAVSLYFSRFKISHTISHKRFLITYSDKTVFLSVSTKIVFSFSMMPLFNEVIAKSAKESVAVIS